MLFEVTKVCTAKHRRVAAPARPTAIADRTAGAGSGRRQQRGGRHEPGHLRDGADRWRPAPRAGAGDVARGAGTGLACTRADLRALKRVTCAACDNLLQLLLARTS